MNAALSRLKEIIDQSFQDDLFLDASNSLSEQKKRYFDEWVGYLDRLPFEVKFQLDEETLYFKVKKKSCTVANLHSAYARMIASLVSRRTRVEEELSVLALDGASTLILRLLNKAIESCEAVLEMLEDEYPTDINLDDHLVVARHGVLITMHEPRYNGLLREFRLRPASKEGLMAVVAELIHPFFDHEVTPTQRRFAVIRHFLASLEGSLKAKSSVMGRKSITSRDVVKALIMANHNEPFVVETFKVMLEQSLARISLKIAIAYLKRAFSFLKTIAPPRREGSVSGDASLWHQLHKLLQHYLERVTYEAERVSAAALQPTESRIKLGISVEAFALIASLASDAKILESPSQASLARKLIQHFSRQDGEVIAEKSMIKRMSSPSEKAIAEVQACLELMTAKLNRRIQLAEPWVPSQLKS